MKYQKVMQINGLDVKIDFHVELASRLRVFALYGDFVGFTETDLETTNYADITVTIRDMQLEKLAVEDLTNQMNKLSLQLKSVGL